MRTAAEPGGVRKDIWTRRGRRAASGYIAKRSHLERLVVILAPLEIVDGSRSAGVVAVGVRVAGQLGERIGRSGLVAVRFPVQALAGPVEDPVHAATSGRRGGEEQRSGEAILIGRARNQVAVTRMVLRLTAAL